MAAHTAEEIATEGDLPSAGELLTPAETAQSALDPVLASAFGFRADTSAAVPFQFQHFGEEPLPHSDRRPPQALDDLNLDLRIELGRAELLIEDVQKLREGSVVPLDKLAGDPVDILVNGRLIARGEVLVLNDNFCVRVAEILTPRL